MVSQLAMAGGLFALLSFIHFVVDWVFQTHQEAMIKHNHPWVRAKHCFIYTIGFMPILFALDFPFWKWLISVGVLFISHFYLDTYHLVYLWAKYIRKPPEMVTPETKTHVDGYIEVLPPSSKRGFIKFVDTTLGKILMISIDQISHLMFLWVIVLLAIIKL
jgi:hypothetical protein